MIIEKKRLIYSHLNLKTKIKLICLFSTKNCKKKTNKKRSKSPNESWDKTKLI